MATPSGTECALQLSGSRQGRGCSLQSRFLEKLRPKAGHTADENLGDLELKSRPLPGLQALTFCGPREWQGRGLGRWGTISRAHVTGVSVSLKVIYTVRGSTTHTSLRAAQLGRYVEAGVGLTCVPKGCCF